MRTRAVRVPSAVRRRVGAIIDPMRVPGGVDVRPRGCRSASPMTLLSWMPVPGTKTPEQLPPDDEPEVERVRDAEQPDADGEGHMAPPRTGDDL